MATPKRKNIDTVASYYYDEATDTYIAWDGEIISSTTSPVYVSEVPVVDTPEYFEDTSFVTGDSPATLDINAALGRNATTVSILNDGAGNFTYALSADGVSFGDSITIKRRERHEYVDVSVDSVRITWVSDSAYRVIAI